MTCDPDWTNVVSALLTPVIAIAAGMIAWRQWRTAQSKLKLDLFDRRFAIYQAAQTFVLSARSTKIDQLDHLKFLEQTHQARWLLDEDLARFLKEELYARVVDLQTLMSELADLPAGAERSENVKRQRDLRNALDAELTELDRRFAPFIHLSH